MKQTEYFITMRRKDLMPIACHETFKEAAGFVASKLEDSLDVVNAIDTALFIVKVATP